MGYIRHHSIVVTSWGEHIKPAHAKALGLFGLGAVSPVIDSDRNDYRSFFVAPDGSKEGWDESDKGDSLRQSFIYWLREQYHEDGSTNISWVEIQYADEEGETKVCGSSDDDNNAFRESHEELASGFWDQKEQT